MKYEYKVVSAPEKPKRVRGVRNPSDRVAAAFEEILQEHAVDGWEYLRTDTLPVTEKASWLAHPREVRRAVMVFRRPVEAVWQRPVREETRETGEAQAQPPRREPSVAPAQRPAPGPEPTLGANPDRRLAEIVRGPGARSDDR